MSIWYPQNQHVVYLTFYGFLCMWKKQTLPNDIKVLHSNEDEKK